ncbi:hypothetical protein MY3296_008591 [Beauveria thailandica]
MDASYDEIPLQVQVPPAQIYVPAYKQKGLSSGYEVLREMLHLLAVDLEPKSHYCMPVRFIPIASQIEEMLRDFMLDHVPPPAPAIDWLGSYPLEWFLCMGRQQFVLTEDDRGRVFARRQSAAGPEELPSTKYLPSIPRDLPAIPTAHLKVAPMRCGKNRISGNLTVDMGQAHHGAHTYTFVCMRELGTRASAEGCHRAMAYQIQQLEMITHDCGRLGAEQRRNICIPEIRAYLYHELALKPDRLPVGALFEELPKLVPLRSSNAPPEVFKECVLRICKTVEWLVDRGIGWGGSVAYPHKGHALLDAIVVDAFGRPWLMEGFTDTHEDKLLSDRVSVHMLRLEFGLLGAEPAIIVGNHVEIIFELNTKAFCLFIPPFRKQTLLPPYFTRTCNALVHLVLQATAGNWHLGVQKQISDSLASIPKPELLSICRGKPEIPGFCFVQLYFRHAPRSCSLQPNAYEEPVIRLSGDGFDLDSHALDREDRYFASQHATARISNISANDVSVTVNTAISASRICGEVRRRDNTKYYIIAARDASVRGTRRWECPERRQLVVRQALQAACAADPGDDGCIRVPELLAYVHDEDMECDRGVRLQRIMGALYRKIDGITLRLHINTPQRREPTAQALADRITSMMASLHRRGFVWGGEHQDGQASVGQEAKTLMDCLVLDKQGYPWLMDGFGATYHEDVVRSDEKALASLLTQMKINVTEPVEAFAHDQGSGSGWPEQDISSTACEEYENNEKPAAPRNLFQDQETCSFGLYVVFNGLLVPGNIGEVIALGIQVRLRRIVRSGPGNKVMILSAVIALFDLGSLVTAGPYIQGTCIRSDTALQWLASRLSKNSAISCRGQPLQLHNANRYWGEQFGKNASVVVYPATAKDVSRAVQAANWSKFGTDFSIVGGAHGQINASSSYGFVLDMSWMNSSRLVRKFRDPGGGKPFAAVEYQGGANWGQVQSVTNGTGYTAIGARVASVGAGGFSLGGGIGFLAGAYGFATDRLVQMEVVLPSGQIVTATKTNKHSSLFWALQGGSGQFGIVTRFWQRAVVEPKRSTIAFYYIKDADVSRLRHQVVEFFKTNKDPFSVVYYSFGYLPDNLDSPTPESYGRRTLLITVHFDDPTSPTQPDNTRAFKSLLDGIDVSHGIVIQADDYSDLVFLGGAAYPYGYRRGFYGAQTSEIDVDYLAKVTDTFWKYVDTLIERGETPYSASFVMQYMYPGLNGHLPKSDGDTAWPHAHVGHQTLFTPAYKHSENDVLTVAAVQELNRITYAQQKKVGSFLANYPNYIAPGDSGCRVWGRNVKRLAEIKQRYDPGCLIRNGRVFASRGCTMGGWANVFDDCA